jgi:hypothetical protein
MHFSPTHSFPLNDTMAQKYWNGGKKNVLPNFVGLVWLVRIPVHNVPGFF